MQQTDHVSEKQSDKQRDGRRDKQPDGRRGEQQDKQNWLATAIALTERGFVPDSVVRLAIRGLCLMRLRETKGRREFVGEHVEFLRRSPMAEATEQANEQHYEVPARFFELVLGRHLKYSSGFWPVGCRSLDDSEKFALDETVAHAGLRDGQEVLELGCGWGSLSLFMAEKYPNSRITSISNSASQRQFIEARAAQRGLSNLRVLTQNVAQFDPSEFSGRFDRVVSVEMFEHFRNYELLLERISGWLKSDGELFVHIFTHQTQPYIFETEGADNWMGRYFFTGGQMPNADIFSSFDKHLKVYQQWSWSGTHYQKTARAWLDNLDLNRDEILELFSKTYGADQAAIWVQRWRIFMLSVEELFGFRGGSEWGVTHYRFQQVSSGAKHGGLN